MALNELSRAIVINLKSFQLQSTNFFNFPLRLQIMTEIDSMDEADVLCQRIGIMTKGYLRTIGVSRDVDG